MSSLSTPTLQSPPAAAPPRRLPTFVQESRDTFALALPLIAGQLGQMLMSVADTVMVGRLGVVPLGAATFANTLLSLPFVVGIGLLTSISVSVSQARGAERPQDAAESLRHGAMLALAFGLVVIAAAGLLLPGLHWFGQPADVTAATPGYLFVCAVSLVPAFLALALKNHADALNRPWTPFWITLGGVALNVGLNWLLIWGHWGFPALGLVGTAYATLTARIGVAIGIFYWLTRSRSLSVWMPVHWLERPRRAIFNTLLALGIPASLQIVAEVGAFASASLLIGTLGSVPLAAHQVAITCAATAFMIPLGIGMALTVRVGEVVGAREPARLRRVLAGGWVFAVGVMSLTMVIFLLRGQAIAELFVTDPAVVAIAAKLLVIAGLFQLFDGVQIVSSGALRGIGDVRVPVRIATLTYWGVALPVGAVLGLWFGYGATGMWTGLAVGLAVAAAALSRRAWRRLGPDFYPGG